MDLTTVKSSRDHGETSGSDLFIFENGTSNSDNREINKRVEVGSGKM